jgi:hypothetical protein
MDLKVSIFYDQCLGVMNKMEKERCKSKGEVVPDLLRNTQEYVSFIYLFVTHSIKSVGYRTCKENTYSNNKIKYM